MSPSTARTSDRTHDQPVVTSGVSHAVTMAIAGENGANASIDPDFSSITTEDKARLSLTSCSGVAFSFFASVNVAFLRHRVKDY